PPLSMPMRRAEDVGEWAKPVGLFIPQVVKQKKQEVLGARDAEVTLCAQTRGGLCHACVDRRPAAEPLTKHRSTSCPHAHDPRKKPPKPDGAVSARRRSVWSVIAVRRNTPLRPSNRPSMTWGCLTTS